MTILSIWVIIFPVEKNFLCNFWGFGRFVQEAYAAILWTESGYRKIKTARTLRFKIKKAPG